MEFLYQNWLCMRIDVDPFLGSHDHRIEIDVLQASSPSVGRQRRGSSQRHTSVVAAAPSNCARMNAATSSGRIPAKVLLAARASVTAGLAKEVDAVNQ